jgi:hypothetical protein
MRIRDFNCLTPSVHCEARSVDRNNEVPQFEGGNDTDVRYGGDIRLLRESCLILHEGWIAGLVSQPIVQCFIEDSFHDVYQFSIDPEG